MLIIKEANKDTYVNNRKTSYNDGIYSNVGKAATLDLFKLFNENKKEKISFLKFTNESTPQDLENFTITDANNNSVNFIFVSNTENTELTLGNNLDNSSDSIYIGLGLENSEYTQDQLIEFIVLAINSVNSVEQNGPSGNLKLNINAINVNNIIVLQHLTYTVSDVFILNETSNIEISEFASLENSNILVSFDIDDLFEKLVYDYDKSIFNTDNFKCEIVLHDVTSGNIKPFNYKLVLKPMNKIFDEGFGKDTIHFSDFGICNFETLSNQNENNILWENKGFVTDSIDTFINDEDEESYISECFITEPDQNAVFDITKYIKNYFKYKSDNTNAYIPNKGFLISFDDEYIYNYYTYFVKRFGSRHLTNKKFVPKLIIKINEESLQYKNIPSKKLKRYFDNNEYFYIKNIKNGIQTDFLDSQIINPNKNITVVADVYFNYIDEELNEVENYILEDELTEDVDDFKGERIKGLKMIQINDTLISRFDSLILNNLVNKQSLDINILWKYKIFDIVAETTEYIDILSEVYTFYIHDKETEYRLMNLRCSLSTSSLTCSANDSVSSFKVMFFDKNRHYSASKHKFDLECENLGEVYYDIYDDINNTLLFKSDEQIKDSKLLYLGDCYTFSFYNSAIYKNKILRFVFYFYDENKEKIIIDDKNQKVRFV